MTSLPSVATTPPLPDAPTVVVSTDAPIVTKEELTSFLARLTSRIPTVAANVVSAQERLKRSEAGLEAAKSDYADAQIFLKNAEDSVGRLDKLIAEISKQLGA